MEWLTEKELSELTETAQPSKQIKWLKKHQVRFFVGLKGHPRVFWCHLKQEERRPAAGPNLEAVRKLRKV